MVVAAVISSDRTTSSRAFSLQDFTLFSLPGLMLMPLHFSGFCQALAEGKGELFRGEILIYYIIVTTYNSRAKWSSLCLQAYCTLWFVFYKLGDSSEAYIAIEGTKSITNIINFNYHEKKKQVFIMMHRTTLPIIIKSIKLSSSLFDMIVCCTLAKKYLHFCGAAEYISQRAMDTHTFCEQGHLDNLVS